jgi:hypothetical protein
MKKLHLHVKTEYFDQIKSGLKTEEFRLHNAYWIGRLIIMPGSEKREFSSVLIYDAYRGTAPLEFPWRGWTLKGITHPHFGPDEVTVFAIKLEEMK